MIRKTIHLYPYQAEWLKRRAKVLGISQSKVIGRMLNETEQPGISRPCNPSAWQEELAFIRRRAKELPALNKPRTWTREELYEERLGRF